MTSCDLTIGIDANKGYAMRLVLLLALAGAAQSVGAQMMQPPGVFRDCPSCPEMVSLPAGKFTMGSPSTERERDRDEEPVHQVSLAHGFAVGKWEVTFAQWDACVADGGCKQHP